MLECHEKVFHMQERFLHKKQKAPITLVLFCVLHHTNRIILRVQQQE